MTEYDNNKSSFKPKHVLPNRLYLNIHKTCKATKNTWLSHFYFAFENVSDEDFEKLSIPVGGDQLTRVRLQGAKLLLAGSHTSEEGLENLSPMIIELFHTMQDFLQVNIKMIIDFSISIQVE